jgi:hypothetical protein
MGFRHPTYNWVWSVGDFVSMFQGESHYEESIKEIFVTLLESAFQQNPTIVSVESKNNQKHMGCGGVPKSDACCLKTSSVTRHIYHAS